MPLQDFSFAKDICIKALPITAVVYYRELLREICIKHPIPLYYKSIFICILLSGGWANIHRKTKLKAQIPFCQPYVNKEYIYHIVREIHVYCEKDPYRFNGNPKGKPIDVILISTKWLFSFMDLYDMFYIKNVTRVPCNIYDLLTPFVLAHWVMGAV